ncbi:MAG: hypothetical protein D3916_14620 [Candidatus Electrothrix sp. MAN1_4]|nr:hypothetical protein [Candidatus Electrothrix sp. MAN1_4]
MEYLDYGKLYQLQDEVLDIVFQEETEFYLTGGTCLNRFYFEKRYSDDLDLFTHCSDTFSYSVRAVTGRFTQKNMVVKKLLESRDFIRIHLTKKEIVLQVDFVNDRIQRFGDFSYQKGYRLDNTMNILSNKITAVIGRDNPKDVFDIFLIARYQPVDWGKILAEASEKLHFQKEDLLYRLRTFPYSLLNSLNLVDEQFLDNFELDFQNIIEEIQKSSFLPN